MIFFNPSLGFLTFYPPLERSLWVNILKVQDCLNQSSIKGNTTFQSCHYIFLMKNQCFVRLNPMLDVEECLSRLEVKHVPIYSTPKGLGIEEGFPTPDSIIFLFYGRNFHSQYILTHPLDFDILCTVIKLSLYRLFRLNDNPTLNCFGGDVALERYPFLIFLKWNGGSLVHFILIFFINLRRGNIFSSPKCSLKEKRGDFIS